MSARFTTLLAIALLLAGCATAPAPETGDIPDLSRYRAVLVESVRVAPEAGLLSSPNRQALERRLRTALVASIPAEQRALAPAADVLRVQVTITALDGVDELRPNAGTRVGLSPERGAIAFEVRYYRLGAAMPFATVTEQHKSNSFAFGDNFSHYGHAVGALRDWGTDLADSLPGT